MKHCDKRAVTVNVTNRCNLRCIYCMASSKEEQQNPIDISLDFAKVGIKDALNGYPTGEKADKIRFFAPGEPTQNMSIMKECVEYARSLNPEIKTELQTNGLFETVEDKIWIGNNINEIWFSVDGWAGINDKNRPDPNGKGRTKEIEDNMLYLIHRGRFVGVRSTINSSMFSKQKELVIYYYKMGIRYICLNPITIPVKRNVSNNVRVYKDNIVDFADGFLEAYDEAEKLGCILMNSFTFNFDEETSINCRSCIPMPQLNPDGTVSACDKATYKDTKEELKCFLYGEWCEEEKIIKYDCNKIDKLRNRSIYNMDKCRECEYAQYCGGNCAGRVAYETGDMYQVIDEHCDVIKKMAKHMKLGRNIVEHTHP